MIGATTYGDTWTTHQASKMLGIPYKRLWHWLGAPTVGSGNLLSLEYGDLLRMAILDRLNTLTPRNRPGGSMRTSIHFQVGQVVDMLTEFPLPLDACAWWESGDYVSFAPAPPKLAILLASGRGALIVPVGRIAADLDRAIAAGGPA